MRPRTLTFAFLISALVLALLIICRLLWPFAEPVGFALIMAVSLYPLHRRLLRILRYETAAALISTVAVLLLLIIPIVSILYLLSAEMLQVGSHLSQITTPEKAHELADKLMAPFGSAGQIGAARLHHSIQNAPRLASDYLVTAGTLLIAGFAGIAGKAVVTFFVLFFLFRDGERMTHIVAFLLPLHERHTQHLFHQVRRSIVSNLYGMLAVAAVQAVLALAGYAAFGIPSAGLLALLTGLASLVPVLGTAVVWVPVAAYLLLKGALIRGVLLFFWGLIIIAGSDNLIRAKVIQSDVELNPLFLILAILGGVEVFGLLGVFLGPLLLAIIEALVDMLRDELIAAKLAELDHP